MSTPVPDPAGAPLLTAQPETVKGRLGVVLLAGLSSAMSVGNDVNAVNVAHVPHRKDPIDAVIVAEPGLTAAAVPRWLTLAIAGCALLRRSGSMGVSPFVVVVLLDEPVRPPIA